MGEIGMKPTLGAYAMVSEGQSITDASFISLVGKTAPGAVHSATRWGTAVGLDHSLLSSHPGARRI